MFDVTSWQFFSEAKFADAIDRTDFFVALVLAPDVGYQGDIFIFPVKDFVGLLKMAIPTKDQRKVYISRLKDQPDRWVLRRKSGFVKIDEASAVDVSRYRRNFELLGLPSEADEEH